MISPRGISPACVSERLMSEPGGQRQCSCLGDWWVWRCAASLSLFFFLSFFCRVYQNSQNGCAATRTIRVRMFQSCMKTESSSEDRQQIVNKRVCVWSVSPGHMALRSVLFIQAVLQGIAACCWREQSLVNSSRRLSLSEQEVGQPPVVENLYTVA